MKRIALSALLACLIVAPAAWSADRGPVLRKAVGPVYPQGALPLAPDNTIIAGIRVSADGDVEDVRVLHSEHPGLGFEDAATEAVRQWSFRPARENGKQVSAFEVVRLQFVAPSRLAPNAPWLSPLHPSRYRPGRYRGIPTTDRWPICSGSRSCLAPSGAVWDSSWFLTHDQWIRYILLNHPNLRANFIAPHSTRAALPYKRPPEDQVGMQPGGFLFSSWERYQEGVGPMIETIGGIGKAKSTELNYPNLRANRPRALYRDLSAEASTASARAASSGRATFATYDTRALVNFRTSHVGSRTVAAGTVHSAVRSAPSTTTRRATSTATAGRRQASPKTRTASTTTRTKR